MNCLSLNKVVEARQGIGSNFENRGEATGAFLLGLAIFGWALFGIFTRQSGTLAAFWPANAFLLAMLIRFPGLVSRYAWPAAFLGYVAADILTGSTLRNATLLTLTNLGGVTAGYLLLQRLNEDDRRLQRPLSVLFVVLVLATASSVAGLGGAIVNPIIFGGDAIGGFGWWFVAEFVNYVAIVSVILAIPEHSWLTGERRRYGLKAIEPKRLLPLVVLLLSALPAVFIAGPGALAFPVPALLWCAVSYSLFTTCVLTLLFSVWTLLGLANGILQVQLGGQMELISLRLGVVLVALAPIMVASILEARQRLIEQLRHLSQHDHMTGLRNRASFMDLGRAAVAQARYPDRVVAVMMLDIDRFKFINDTYGHRAGDQVLLAFAQSLRNSLRGGDIIGRIGGEEFAAVLPKCDGPEAEIAAYRVLNNLSDLRIEVGSASLAVTVSIGLTVCREPKDLDDALAEADRALYLAKRKGRNRVEVFEIAV